jgi:hypothetical protein
VQDATIRASAAIAMTARLTAAKIACAARSL